jgi:glycerol kinase
LGAGYLAGLASGTWTSLDEIADLWRPLSVVEPQIDTDRARQRAKWAESVTRASGWRPELSSLDF